MSTEELLALEVVPTSLGAEELEEFARKHLVVSYQLKGLSAAEALARANVDRSQAWATRLRRRYEQFGAGGLLDLRKFNGKKEDVMTSEVKSIVLAIWHTRTAAGAPLVAELAKEECRKQKLPVPSKSAVKAYLDELPEHIKLTRGGHFQKYERCARPTLQLRLTRRANERFQSDHTRLDIWAKILQNGVWIPVVLWLTVLLDDFSRAIAGIAVTEGSANSWSITQALRHAVLPKTEPGWIVHGKPGAFQCDRGGDYMSHSIQATMAVLGIQFDPDPPYYPNKKGKVERWFQTLDQACLRALPGHMEEIGRSEGAAQKNLAILLTPDQIEREMKRWIVEEYHQRTHSSTDRKPLDLWRETVHLSVPAEEDVFRVLLRKDDMVRTVQPMITFRENHDGGDYWSPDLLRLYGRQVRVAYNPEDMRRIVLHCAQSGEFLAEPWLLRHPESPWTEEHVLRERAAFKRGLKTQIGTYRAESAAREAEAGADAEWAEAREQVDAEESPPQEREAEDPEAAETAAILEEMRTRRPKDDC